MNIVIQELKCKRCQHKWVPRNPKVFVCPKCKSARWDDDEGKIIMPKNTSTDELLKIMANNPIFAEDLIKIGHLDRK